ncbi:Rod shape-determining protein RodA [Rickettsiales endosymbiont of Paramecium tredecaurelia]|uniref:rod shape-determining protein RodA n=1 Tax=Candidatus Sarmatiella mevalonica TaxID=2770581 RepID=UPI001922FDD3|nr:rod shape-determining protein RodA [Candidatus Sarmatiella mevalonica]MBL3285230.1 Rod shape-determining protein RodA [Candidatus Sarmatiella mevalonica]
MYKQGIVNKIKKIPISIILVIALLSGYGVMALYSISFGQDDGLAYTQAVRTVVLFVVMIFVALLDIQIIYRCAYYLYALAVLLLLGVEFVGVSAMGAKRWINLGVFKLQPAELFKFALILMLSRFFHKCKEEQISDLKTLCLLSVIVLAPIALIIKQPDLGTGLLALGVVIAIFFAAGLAAKIFLWAALLCICASPIAWSMMHDYQKKRVLVFLNPELDPLGAGYNILQSKISIGSGGLFGKGFGKGTQTHLNFLPEHETDFAFAGLSEEFGFIGCVVLIVLYMLLCVLSLWIAMHCHAVFAKMNVVGVVSMLFIHFIINIGMVTGLLPVVGIPLPFVSYGGTILASAFLGMGLILNSVVHEGCRIEVGF